MSRPATPEQLMNSAEFARLAGVRQSALSNWIERGPKPGRPTVPEPWGVFGKTKLYHVDDVEDFIADRRASQSDTAAQLREAADRLLRRADRLEER